MKTLYESIFDDIDQRAEDISRRANCPEYRLINSITARKGDPARQSMEDDIQEINNYMKSQYHLDTIGYIYTEGTGGVISNKSYLYTLVTFPCSDNKSYLREYTDNKAMFIYNFDTTKLYSKHVKDFGFKSIVQWRKWKEDYLDHFKKMGIKVTDITHGNKATSKYHVYTLE